MILKLKAMDCLLHRTVVRKRRENPFQNNQTFTYTDAFGATAADATQKLEILFTGLTGGKAEGDHFSTKRTGHRKELFQNKFLEFR